MNLIILACLTWLAQAQLSDECKPSLGELTADQATRVLRSLQEVAPTLSAEDLAARPTRMRAVTTALGRPLTPAGFERELKRIYGHRIAALEHAGFETLNLPNPTPDRDDWTPKLVAEGLFLARSNKESTPDRRTLLLRWPFLERQLRVKWKRPVSAYSLWRAARRLRPDFDRRERLALAPGSVRAYRDRSLAILERVARTSLVRRHLGLAVDLAAYLEDYDDFNDRARLVYHLTRRRPDMTWYMDMDDLYVALEPERR